MGFGDDGMSVKYGGSNSLTKLLQLIKSRFSVIGHTHTVLGDSTTKTVTVNANGVSECSSTASGINSHAEGYNSTASGRNSHAEGAANTASGVNAHAEGGSTTASDTNAHAEGAYTKATKPASHAEGDSSEAIASNAHAEGYHAKASGDNSHAEGSYTIASTSNSHAEGAGTQASGAQSHAEGGSAKATGPQSHAEGGSTTASGINAHAEGGTTTASGVNAHSEGAFSNATASAAHAEGDHANAYHDNSHAEGSYTETGCANQHVAGKYNVVTSGMAEVIGNGTGDNARSNARTLDWNGNAWFAGEVSATETRTEGGTTTTITHNLTQKADADHNHDGDYVNIDGDVMTGDLEFQRIAYKRIRLFDGDTLEYECVVENDNAKRVTYDTSMTEIGSYSLVDNIGYTSINFSEGGSIVAWAQVRMSDSIVDIEPGEYTPRSAGHGSELESPKLVVSAFSIETTLEIKADGQMLIRDEQMYPTFIREGWSTSSDQSTLPVTPCFVLNPTNSAYYYCDGQMTITRINPTPPVTGVKGNSESSYRTGNVNITAANVGAQAAMSVATKTSGVFTPNTGITVSSQNVKTWGKLCAVDLLLEHTSSWTQGTQYNVGTLASGYRPIVGSTGAAGTSGIALAITNGNVYVRDVSGAILSANTGFYVRLTYMLA